MSPAELELHKAFSSLITPVPQILEYRLYYNDLGEITSCSMQQHADNGTYIVVTKDEYDTYFKYKVVKGKLKIIDNDDGYSVQLRKADAGVKVVKGHAGLIIEPEETYNNIEYYEYRANRHRRS